MKKRNFETTDFEKRFRNDKLEKRQLNYLVGGDGEGSQGGTNPWPNP